MRIWIYLCFSLALGSGSEVFQSSQYINGYPELALDGDSETCAMTGFGRGGWWVYQLDTPRNVSQLTLLGSASAYQVRVGYDFNFLGQRGEFDKNALCHFAPALEEGILTNIDCPAGLHGDIVSVHGVDRTSSERLILCEVAIQFTV